jgi:medium-chain acyl-[acyl-carrier-protein] hydrolase
LGALLRLFCFPFAGGSALAFRQLSRQLAGRIQVHPIELPGRGRRRAEPCIERWPELTTQLVAELEPHLSGSFAFLGYSLGAFVALEVIHELMARRACPPPPLWVCAAAGPRAIVHGELMHRMQDKAMFQALHKLGGVPDELFESQELIALSAPFVRADLKLFETYAARSEPLHGVPIRAYHGRTDTTVGDAYRAWREETDASFESRVFDGGHMFLDSAVEALAEAIVADTVSHEPCALSL